MMSPQKHTYDDELMIAYLLGATSASEAERLDELSIADDEFAARLAAVENDLVDDYVRGELPADRRERFRSVYLASPVRRQKIAAAESLVSIADRRGAAAGFPRWALAAAACLLLTAGGLLILRVPGPPPPAASPSRPQAAQLPPVQPPSAPPAPRSPITVALVLPPQLRGVASIPTLNLPPAADRAQFHLEMESDEFSAYRVALRNPATSRVMWQSEALRSEKGGQTNTVSVSVPTDLFQTQNYTFELTGVTGGGGGEFVGSYSFRVVK
jgi:hypothetical protein